MYESKNPLFKSLTDEEEKQYREWARKTYKRFEPIKGIWHPVVQDECKKINESGTSIWG